MGKIQDAIRKVRRDRGAVSLAPSGPRRLAIDNQESVLQRQDAVTSHDVTADAYDWQYGGQRIKLDRKKLIDAHILDPDHVRKHLAKEYREVKRALLANMAGENTSGTRLGNLIMVSSAKPGEGRSYICLNLSMSLALETGYSVVLVDSDIKDPRLTKLLGVEGKEGLADLLADPSLESIQTILPTDVPGLSILPVGKNRKQALEFFCLTHRPYCRRLRQQSWQSMLVRYCL
jgi:Mrp family chromosome partitioning ATPase